MPLPTPTDHIRRFLRRPARRLRRTRFLLSRTRADIGLGGPRLPVWLRDNPFLVKAGRTETRRLVLLLRLGVCLLLLSGLTLGGLWADRAYARQMTQVLGFLFGLPFPAALFVVLTFLHATLVSGTRAAQSVSLADEAQRGTLPDLLLTPLHRAEMLLAMGVAPARSALLVALAGLPLYILLGQFGALTGWDIGFLALLFALISYAPPVYLIPALAGGAMTPETALGKFGLSGARRPTRQNPAATIGFSLFFSVFLLGQMLGLLRGGWLGHFLTALHLHLTSSFSFFLFFAWPAYAAQVLGSRLDFFHLSLSPLFYGLPLLVCWWVASALHSAAALSAGDAAEMARLPIASRARTLSRWTARAAGLCALAVVWRAWVESGDTATLAGGPYGASDWNAAGLLLLLGGLALPTVCARALETSPKRKIGDKGGDLRPPLLVLRRALKRAVRPLAVAGATFLAACALGGLSPFAPPVYAVAGRLALVGAVTILWAVGVRRLLPGAAKVTTNALLYLLPVAALAAPVAGASWLAALSPATAWLRLFPDAPGLLTGIQGWHVAAPPSWEICLIGPALVGALGMMGRPTPRQVAALPEREGAESGQGHALTGQGHALAEPPPPPVSAGVARSAEVGPPRHAARTAALLLWATARTDNPLFTHELRTRTRSGRWLDGLVLGPLALLAASAIGLAYPDILGMLTGASPFHFFGESALTSGRAGTSGVWPDLAALLLAAQCYLLGFRGAVVGEGLIARDRQRGIWGFLLMTPLSARAIFWGKVWGQSLPAGAVWAGAGLASLLLYGLAAPAVGPLPALLAWLAGQCFVAALFALGLALGAALSSFPFAFKSLRGLAGLLFVVLVGLGIAAQALWLPFDLPAPAEGGWALLSGRLAAAVGYALVLAVPLLLFARWRVGRVRAGDVVE